MELLIEPPGVHTLGDHHCLVQKGKPCPKLTPRRREGERESRRDDRHPKRKGSQLRSWKTPRTRRTLGCGQPGWSDGVAHPVGSITLPRTDCGPLLQGPAANLRRNAGKPPGNDHEGWWEHATFLDTLRFDRMRRPRELVSGAQRIATVEGR